MRGWWALAVILALGVFVGQIDKTPIPLQGLKPPSPRLGQYEQHPQSQAAPRDQKSEAEQHGTYDSPLVVKIAPSPDAQPESDQQRESRLEKTLIDRRTLVYVGLTALFTGLLVVVGGGQLAMFLIQLRYMRAGVEDAKTAADAAKEAAVATARVAAAGQESAETMKDTAQRQLRAYVFMRCTDVKKINKDTPLTVGYLIENAGLTPAKNVKTRMAIEIAEFPISPDYDFTVDGSSIPFIVHPKSPVIGEMQKPIRITSDEMDGLRSGAKRVYVYGVVQYEDVFGNGWHTNFCICLRSAGLIALLEAVNAGGATSFQGRWEYAAPHNDIT